MSERGIGMPIRGAHRLHYTTIDDSHCRHFILLTRDMQPSYSFPSSSSSKAMAS